MVRLANGVDREFVTILSSVYVEVDNYTLFLSFFFFQTKT